MRNSKRNATREMRKAEQRRINAAVLIIVLSIALLWAISTIPASGAGSEIVADPESVIEEDDVVVPSVKPEPPALPSEPAPVESETTEEAEEEPAPLWTAEEAEVLAKMLWGEARGIPSDMEKAACVWCVLNRCDLYGESIIEITTAPNQFVGYREGNPVDEALLALCEDVLARWFAEKAGVEDVGRVLPKEYTFFHGDGKNNHFRIEYKHTGEYWDWSLPDPYLV